jgi:hypothetical protein
MRKALTLFFSLLLCLTIGLSAHADAVRVYTFSDGQALTAAHLNNELNNLITYENYLHTPVKFVTTFTNLNTAVSSATTTDKLIVVSDAQTLTGNLTVSSGKHIKVLPSGSIDLAGYTITFQAGSSFECPSDHQAFVNPVAGDITGLTEARPEWWGTDSTAFSCAVASLSSGGTLYTKATTYQDISISSASNITIVVSDGTIFKTSDSGLVPALTVTGCTNVSFKGRIVADGNKTNNTHAYTAANIGYAYATVALYNSSYLNIDDIYVHDSWHDAVTLDTVTFSNIKNINAKDTSQRGVVIYKDSTDNHIGSITATGASTTRAFRHGGSSGHLAKRNTIDSLIGFTVGDGAYVERYSSQVSIGSIVMDTLSAGNGVKIDDANYVAIGKVLTNKTGCHGVIVTAVDEGTSNISIDSITAIDAGELAGTYCGVFIYAAGGFTTQTVNIGRVAASSAGAAGFEIINDGSSTIQDVSVGSIIANSNTTWGVFLDDAGTNQRIHLGSVIASGNTTGDMRVENGVKQFSLGNRIVATANDQQGVNTTLVGNRLVLDATAVDQSTSGTGEDVIWTRTVGSGVMGATSVLHLVASGSKTNTSSEAKTIKLYVGVSGTAITLLNGVTTATSWNVEAWIFNVSAAVQRIMWTAHDGATVTQGVNYETTDTAADFIVKLTGEVGATGSDVITRRMAFLERL